MLHNFRNLHIIIFVSIKWKSGKVKKSGIRNRVKLKHKSGNYYVSIEIISAGSGSGDPVACWVCGWCSSGDITYRILVICWVLVVVVVETGGGAAQLSDPSLAWPASSGPGAADTASPCVQPQHQHQHQHCTLTPGRGASCVTNSASRSSS